MLSGIKTGKKKKAKKQKTEHHVQAPTTANTSAADRLRQALASSAGESLPPTSHTPTNISTSDSLDHLRGKGGGTVRGSRNDEDAVVITNYATSKKDEAEMTVQELSAAERHKNSMSWDEQATRNLARLGKKRHFKNYLEMTAMRRSNE